MASPVGSSPVGSSPVGSSPVAIPVRWLSQSGYPGGQSSGYNKKEGKMASARRNREIAEQLVERQFSLVTQKHQIKHYKAKSGKRSLEDIEEELGILELTLPAIVSLGQEGLTQRQKGQWQKKLFTGKGFLRSSKA